MDDGDGSSGDVHGSITSSDWLGFKSASSLETVRWSIIMKPTTATPEIVYLSIVAIHGGVGDDGPEDIMMRMVCAVWPQGCTKRLARRWNCSLEYKRKEGLNERLDLFLLPFPVVCGSGFVCLVLSSVINPALLTIPLPFLRFKAAVVYDKFWITLYLVLCLWSDLQEGQEGSDKHTDISFVLHLPLSFPSLFLFSSPPFSPGKIPGSTTTDTKVTNSNSRCGRMIS